MASSPTSRLPFAKVSFVRQQQCDEQQDCDVAETSSSNCLSGSEARSFYESVVQSTSSAQNVKSAVNTRSTRQTRQGTLNKSSEVYEKASTYFSERGVNAFLKAAAEGNTEALRQYVEMGMNVNVVDDFDWTAIMCAAYSGHLSAVRFLKSQNADVDCVDRRGRSAFDLAVEQRHQAVADCLTSESDSSQTRSKTKEKLRKPEYCGDCKIPYTECSHHTSTVHLLSTKTPRQDPGYGIPHTNAGYRMLQRHGWDEYSGLGKEGKGKRYPVKTILKRDRKGLGNVQPKPKVTHFGPADTDAVVGTHPQQVRLKSTTVAKRQLAKVEARTKRWEADFRRQFVMD
uniref:G-patch domain-containing protein n=1 Tax=Plectus sambesii TaxID=2011161 RepID=A0A914W5R1_9BILA